MGFSNKELGKYLKTVRESLGYSTYDVNKLCDISPSYLSLMENGKRKPSPIILKKLSPIYNLNYIELLEMAGFIDLIEKEQIDKNIEGLGQKTEKGAVVFVYGTIPAGMPIECIEDIIDTEEISVDMLKGGKEYFGLRVKGNSMEPEYLDGDTLILLKQEDCENGDDCVVMVNGQEGTFKRVFKNENGIILQPLNSAYDPVPYTNKEIEELPVRILGVVEEIRRKKKRKK